MTSELRPGQRPWVFLTTHGYVLLTIAEDPTLRVRDVAARVQLTERVAMRTIQDLVTDGYLGCRRVGRRNVYEVHEDAPLRHPRWQSRPIRDMLAMARCAPHAHQPTGDRPSVDLDRTEHVLMDGAAVEVWPDVIEEPGEGS